VEKTERCRFLRENAPGISKRLRRDGGASDHKLASAIRRYRRR